MNSIRVLHLCSYYNTSSLYKNLFDSLDKMGVNQDVYIPMYKNQELVSSYGTVHSYSENHNNITFLYSRIMHSHMRYLLVLRTLFAASYIANKRDVKSYNMLHAHSLLFNGGIAYVLKKRYGIKYIVAVRNTDLYVLNKLPFYKPFANRIVNNSEKVVFISNSIEKRFNALMGHSLKSHAIVIPNGISSDWYTNNTHYCKKDGEPFHFVYQGTLHHRKRLPYVINIIDCLNNNGYKCDLLIVGEGPDKTEIIEQMERCENKSQIRLSGWSNSIDQIKTNYLNADAFIMLSYDETFGISYIEALACGTPIVYTKHDGIDGMVLPEQGLGLKCISLEDDVIALEEFISNYNYYKNGTNKKTFSWDEISVDYYSLYKTL